MGSTKEIKIVNFIMPHVFFISLNDDEYRTNFVNTLSKGIQKNTLGVIQKDDLTDNEIVAVNYESLMVRATVLAEENNKEDNCKFYHCWLIDCGLLIKTEKLLKLPQGIQKIPPICKQASLDNFCYLKTHLELSGVTGKIVTESTAVPPQNVTRKALDLLSNNEKIGFEEKARHGDIVTGEVIIHKNGKVLYLKQELIEAGLIGEDDKSLFPTILDGSKQFMKAHLTLLYKCSSVNKVSVKVSAGVRNVLLENMIADMDLEDSFRTENGRRHRRSKPNSALATSDSDANSPNSKPKSCETSPAENPKPLSKHQLLMQKVKALREAAKEAEPKNRESYAANKYEEGDTSSHDSISVCSSQSEKIKSPDEQSSSVNDILELGHESGKENSSSLVNGGTESGNECSEGQSSSLINSSNIESDCKVSSFASITSQKSNRPRLPIFAAETFSTKQKPPSRKPKTMRKLITRTKNKVSKVTPVNDDDCPTIQIPKIDSSDEDVESKPEKGGETSSSESVKRDIFTKQDFCRLVAGCTCIKCRTAVEDDDWDVPITYELPEEGVKKPTQSQEIIIKPPKLLKPESVTTGQDVSQNEVLSIDYAGMTSMEKKLSSKVLVHSESIPVPIRHVSKVNIHKDIYNSISTLSYKDCKRIQHHAFPAITRNQHVIMVHDAKTGKTMAYLPILLSFIMEQKERYSKLLKMGGGPFVVILCNDSKTCEEIYDVMKMILNHYNSKCTLATYPGMDHMVKVEILITMPAVLQHLISKRATNFKRLCHLVLEDADLMLKSHNDLIKKFLNLADQVLEHRNCPKSVQLIMCAQHWTVQMEDILLKLNQIPTVCIGNYLQAALYGKMKFSMKFLDSSHKESSLEQVLHDKYKFTKSVVICNESEIEKIEALFTSKGIEGMFFHQVDQEETILYMENAWNNIPAGEYSVLVCTDEIYNTINITSAQLLIHYSLPHSWSQFTKRFSCLLENIHTPLDNNQTKHELGTHVFVDEDCEPSMSKFVKLVKIAGIEKDLPDKIKQFFMGVSKQKQQACVLEKVELCNTLKIFGKCDSLFCKKRHILHKGLDSGSEGLPKNGTIRFKIITMTSAGSCVVKLLEHFDLNGQLICKYKDYSQEIHDIIADMKYYKPVSEGHISEIYLNKDQDQYSRCRLLEIGKHILIYLIDKGIYCKSDISRLFEMPENLKKIPPQAYEIHFANLIPPYNDKMFSRRARHKAQFLIDSNCPDSIMTATVMLQIGDNLWVEDVYEYVEMHDKSFPSIGFQLSRQLVKEGLAVKDQTQLQRLYDLCEEAKLELPEYKLVKPAVERVVVEQVKPSWAFLDLDDVHDVIFTSAADPDEFYVRHNKFSMQLQHLEESIQKDICKPFYPKPQKIEIGKCYLVEDEVTGNYSRGLVLSLKDQMAEVLCVDYGDIVDTDVSTLKHISNDHISKLPFQSIQCSLWGIKPIYDEWSSQATDSLYTVAYETEDQTTLRNLALKVNSKQENPFVKNQKSYKVTLATIKDGVPKLVNDLLINCGFAIPKTGEEITIFDLPESKLSNNDDDDYDDKIEDIVREDDDVKELIEREKIDYDAFDFEVMDLDGFLDAIDLSIKPKNNIKAIEDKSPDTNLPPMKAAPAVDYLTPEVYWSETDTHVKLNIKLYDVTEAKFIVKYNRNFQFSTEKNGQKYSLNLILFAKVESTIQHTILGSQVRVLLKKLKATSWPRLLHTKDKVRKIYYDISALNLNDDEKKRLPLQLDISDSSSEEECYYVYSDLDSDYDFDIPNDED